MKEKRNGPLLILFGFCLGFFVSYAATTTSNSSLLDSTTSQLLTQFVNVSLFEPKKRNPVSLFTFYGETIKSRKLECHDERAKKRCSDEAIKNDILNRTVGRYFLLFISILKTSSHPLHLQIAKHSGTKSCTDIDKNAKNKRSQKTRGKKVGDSLSISDSFGANQRTHQTPARCDLLRDTQVRYWCIVIS